MVQQKVVIVLIADLTADGTGNCPTIAAGDNVLENPRYINEVANNPIVLRLMNYYQVVYA